MTQGWIEVGLISDIPRQGSRVVKLPGQDDIAVFRTLDDQIFALVDRCPHKGGPLSQGIVHGHAVACPLHNWRIALASGEAQGEDKGCTPRIEVKRDGMRIFMALPMLVAAQ